jgi:hypothetical protein
MAVYFLWLGWFVEAFSVLSEPADLDDPVYVAVDVVYFGVLAILFVLVWRRMNWARWALLGVFLLAYLALLIQLKALQEWELVDFALNGVISVLQLVALWLLFTGAGAKWLSAAGSNRDL